jgi:hypothetical protein
MPNEEIEIDSIINRLIEKIDWAFENNNPLDEASWGYQHGVLITALEAKKILERLGAPYQARDFNWHCEECDEFSFISSVSQSDIDSDQLSCIECGCTSFRKVYKERTKTI